MILCAILSLLVQSWENVQTILSSFCHGIYRDFVQKLFSNSLSCSFPSNVMLKTSYGKRKFELMSLSYAELSGRIIWHYFNSRLVLKVHQSRKNKEKIIIFVQNMRTEYRILLIWYRSTFKNVLNSPFSQLKFEGSSFLLVSFLNTLGTNCIGNVSMRDIENNWEIRHFVTVMAFDFTRLKYIDALLAEWRVLLPSDLQSKCHYRVQSSSSVSLLKYGLQGCNKGAPRARFTLHSTRFFEPLGFTENISFCQSRYKIV